MDMNLFRKSLASKQKITEAALPPEIVKYKEAKDPTHGVTLDAGRVVANHPAVKQHVDKIMKILQQSLEQSRNSARGSADAYNAYAKAMQNLPSDVTTKVAKDLDLSPIDVTLAYSAFTGA